MMNEVVTAILTLVGGGVGSAIITYQLNYRKEHNVFMRKKAEDLYLASHEFGAQQAIYMTGFLPVVDGRYDYNQMLKLQIDDPPKKIYGGAEMMEVITRIYFPELESQLSEVFAARDAFGAITTEHKQAYMEGGAQERDWKPRFVSAMRRADTAIKAFKNATVQSGRRYAGKGREPSALALAIGE